MANAKSKNALTLAQTIILCILVGACTIFGFYLGQIIHVNSGPATIAVVSPTIIPTRIPVTITPQMPKTCRSNSDCPANEYCTISGPIILDPLTHKTESHATCHERGVAVPM